MNSEGIRTFIMLSKLKNFTRTAERMYVAQSTVTNRIVSYCSYRKGNALAEALIGR